jgi:hypothetical protein
MKVVQQGLWPPNDWILNQCDESKVFNRLKSQNLKQMMNIIDILSHAPKLRVIRTDIQQEISSLRLEGWGGDDSLHWLFMEWYMSNVFHTLDLVVNELVQQDLSPTNILY